MSELSQLLESTDVRLLSIIGPGGMGKSRLALELGHSVKSGFQHGVAFIDLTPVRDPDDIVEVTLSALGVKVGGSKSPHDVLLNYCREKELLLIFDNFEDVLAGASLLADILEHAANVKMIATTREKLNLRVETTFFLEPVGEHGNALFTEVSGMMHPRVEFTEDDQQDIDRVVDLVGGMPLALILASTWVDMLSLAEIAEEIQQSLDFLRAEMGDMPDRQRSIRAVIDPTWKRLSEKEQHAFMWVSVFRGGFTREMFQEVTGASIRALQTLVNRSLVTLGHGRRYDMHPLLRQYAREKLEAHQMLGDAKGSHLQALTRYAQDHAERMYAGHYMDALDALEIEQDNVRGALDWSLQGNDVEHGTALLLAVCDFWLIRSRSREAVAYLEQAVQLTDDSGLHYWLARFLERLGQIDRAIEAVNRALSLAEAAEDRRGLAYATRMRGILVSMADIEEATSVLEQALSIASEFDDPKLLGECHNTLGILYNHSLATRNQAFQHYQQALDHFERIGDLRNISVVTNNIAIEYYNNPERMAEAKELMDYSLQLKQQVGDRAGEARRLANMSSWAISEEEFGLAQQWLAESREICEELGEQARLAYMLETEGFMFLIMMELDASRSALERCLQIGLDIQDLSRVTEVYGLLAQLHLLDGRLDEARSTLVEGVHMAQNATSPPFTLIIVYANYLWQKRDLTACVELAAALEQVEWSSYAAGRDLVTDYFLKPLLFRVKKHVGDEAWAQAIDTTAGVTVKQLFQRMADQLG